jgi:hypothetical protein
LFFAYKEENGLVYSFQICIKYVFTCVFNLSKQKKRGRGGREGEKEKKILSIHTTKQWWIALKRM